MWGPATAPQKEISGPRPLRPASENLIQAGPPRAGHGPPQHAGGRGPELSFHLRGGAVTALIFLSAGRLRAPTCYFVRAGCIFQARIVDENNGTQLHVIV